MQEVYSKLLTVKQIKEKQNAMNLVNYTPNPNQKPQLTSEQEAKLAALSDEDLDYSDILELDDDFWENARILYPDLTLLKLKTKKIIDRK